MYLFVFFFFFKQKPAYEMRIRDWSSDVCSSELLLAGLNLVGLERAGVDSKEIQDLLKAYDELFGAEGTFAERVDAVATRYSGRGTIEALVSFLRAETLRPILQPEEE